MTSSPHRDGPRLVEAKIALRSLLYHSQSARRVILRARAGDQPRSLIGQFDPAVINKPCSPVDGVDALVSDIGLYDHAVGSRLAEYVIHDQC
ncbi:MAG: hypothetical protein WD138_05735, partial [Halofilum sp. (in: g-proteobacteria)]